MNTRIALHASDYDLKNICPSILKYKNRHIDYINKLCIFNPYETSLNSFLSITENRLNIFSNYLIFSIINNFLDNKAVVKKDIESYYNSQMLSFLKNSEELFSFKLKILANIWFKLDTAIDYILSKSNTYDEVLYNYRVYWNDNLNNYSLDIPCIGLYKNQVDIYLILHKDLNKYPLTGTSLDYLHISSVCSILSYFIIRDISIRKLEILWLNDSSFTDTFITKFYLISENDLEFIKANTDSLSIKHNKKLLYNNLNQCFECPYINGCQSTRTLQITKIELPVKLEPNLMRKI